MESSKYTSQPPIIKDLSSPAKEELVIKQKKGKEKISKKLEIETLKEQLKEAGKEISVLKQEAKKHKDEKVQFEQMRKIWEDQVTSVSKTQDNTEKLIKWTQPLRGEVKHIKKINLHLQSNKRALKDKVQDLEKQLELIHEEVEKKGLKMTVVEEPISQLIVNEEETPQE